MSEPGYYAQLAASLRDVATKIEDLPPDAPRIESARLFLVGGFAYNEAAAEQATRAVDTVAAAFGATAKTTVEGRGDRRKAEYEFQLQFGPLGVSTYARIPAPPTQARKVADLQAELDRLNNELAEAKRAKA